MTKSAARALAFLVLSCVPSVHALDALPETTRDQASAVGTTADLERDAHAGDAAAQTKLAIILITGQGRKADPKAGLVLIEKAAEQGHPLAQRIMGDVLSTGRLVRKDVGRAVIWYRRAAEGGDPDAQSELGVRYKMGWGVWPIDDAESVRWELAAASAGDISARMYLASRFEQGRGVPQDFAVAVEQYRKAAERGSAIAMCFLGDMYQAGHGVDVSASDAYQWYFAAFAATPTRRPIRPVDWGPLTGEIRKKCDRSRKNTAAAISPNARANAERAAREWLTTVSYPTIP